MFKINGDKKAEYKTSLKQNLNKFMEKEFQNITVMNNIVYVITALC